MTKLLVPGYADPTQYFLQLDAIALEHQHQLILVAEYLSSLIHKSFLQTMTDLLDYAFEEFRQPFVLSEKVLPRTFSAHNP